MAVPWLQKVPGGVLKATPLIAIVLTAVTIGLTGVIAWVQLDENRAAANRRARDELRLAAVSIVLDAPTCQAAVARAQLASEVLPGVVDRNFAKRVARATSPSGGGPVFVNLVPQTQTTFVPHPRSTLLSAAKKITLVNIYPSFPVSSNPNIFKKQSATAFVRALKTAQRTAQRTARRFCLNLAKKD